MPITINGSTGLTGVAAIDNVSSTELGYLDGVTSAVQTQINAKITDPGAWTTWTPTYSNLTIGSGSVSAKYVLIGKTCHFRFRFVYGSGSAVGTNAAFTLPFALNQTADYVMASFPAAYHDSGTQIYYGSADIGALSSSNSEVTLSVFATSGSYASFSALTATIPMTWATGDKIVVSGTYEVA